MIKFNVNKIVLFVCMLCASTVGYAAELEARLSWAGLQKYGFAVNGVVENVNASVGEKINKNDHLANLDTRPFKDKINECLAAENKLVPLIFDAKQELDQAQELFERTVLSEVELQIIDGKHKTLIDSKKEKQARCQQIKWNASRANLKSKQVAYVLNSNIQPGMIISNENKSMVYMELVSANKASAVVKLNFKQKMKFNLGDELTVIVGEQAIPAIINFIALQVDADNRYRMTAEFHYVQMIEPGKLIKIKY